MILQTTIWFISLYNEDSVVNDTSCGDIYYNSQEYDVNPTAPGNTIQCGSDNVMADDNKDKFIIITNTSEYNIDNDLSSKVEENMRMMTNDDFITTNDGDFAIEIEGTTAYEGAAKKTNI